VTCMYCHFAIIILGPAAVATDYHARIEAVNVARSADIFFSSAG
jgi:hypothetical protein